ncbi:MAG: response regulator [Lacunisphaera sp.]|nr:response regulator [Lacunisphaera sp.]
MSTQTLTQGIAVPVRRTLHILYAEDMRELRILLEGALGRDGHLVESAPDGLVALGRIITAPVAFDLLITDHQMPNMTGLELVGQLRQLPFTGKIIVFSAELSMEVAAAYRRLRVDYILPKPIFPATLRALLTTL